MTLLRPIAFIATLCHVWSRLPIWTLRVPSCWINWEPSHKTSPLASNTDSSMSWKRPSHDILMWSRLQSWWTHFEVITWGRINGSQSGGGALPCSRSRSCSVILTHFADPWQGDLSHPTGEGREKQKGTLCDLAQPHEKPPVSARGRSPPPFHAWTGPKSGMQSPSDVEQFLDRLSSTINGASTSCPMATATRHSWNPSRSPLRLAPIYLETLTDCSCFPLTPIADEGAIRTSTWSSTWCPFLFFLVKVVVDKHRTSQIATWVGSTFVDSAAHRGVLFNYNLAPPSLVKLKEKSAQSASPSSAPYHCCELGCSRSWPWRFQFVTRSAGVLCARSTFRVHVWGSILAASAVLDVITSRRT